MAFLRDLLRVRGVSVLSISAALKRCYIVQGMIWIKAVDMGRKGAWPAGAGHREQAETAHVPTCVARIGARDGSVADRNGAESFPRC